MIFYRAQNFPLPRHVADGKLGTAAGGRRPARHGSCNARGRIARHVSGDGTGNGAGSDTGMVGLVPMI